MNNSFFFPRALGFHNQTSVATPAVQLNQIYPSEHAPTFNGSLGVPERLRWVLNKETQVTNTLTPTFSNGTLSA